MGLFGSICRGISSVAKSVGSAVKSTAKAVGSAAKTVYNGAKKVVEKGVEVVKTGANKLKEGVSKLWGKFSGKEEFEKAEKLYAEITSRYNSRKSSFDAEYDRATIRIESYIKSINDYKIRIKSNLFPEMIEQLQKIKGIEVDKEFNLEEFTYKPTNFESVRSRSQLFKIDFKRDKFKSNMLAIFTLGFASRKMAKESYAAVQEEEYKLNHEISKMDSELVRIHQIEASLKNVDGYFASLVTIYEQLLVRLNNNVNFLYFQCMQFAHQLVDEYMQLKQLPVAQQKEVEAIITASKVMNKMVKAQISNVENTSSVSDFERNLKVYTTEVQNTYKAA